MDFSIFSSPETYMSLLTLSAMEIVLGIDNIIFISILCGRLPVESREKARKVGLFGAFGSRLVLLACISWIIGLVQPLFHVSDYPVSGKAIILFVGGLFLMYKATKEIHEKVEGSGHDSHGEMLDKPTPSFKSVIIQIIILDIVFSLDSVITAVGMSEHISIMILANIIALIVMVLTAKTIGDFVQRHPTVKMLALSFLFLIGTILIAEAAGVHIPKGYIYFAMGFSVAVEMLNLWTKKKVPKA